MVGVINGEVDGNGTRVSGDRSNGHGDSAAVRASAATGPAVELSAAAAFLERRAPRAGLRSAIEASVRDDALEDATRALADAFAGALGRPYAPDAAGSGSGSVPAPAAPAASAPGAPVAGLAEDTAALEGCMQVLLMCLKECGMRADLVTSVARDLAAADTASRSPDIRLRCIALIYNAVPEEQGALRFALLSDIVQFAAAAGLVPRIADTVLPSVDRFLKQWAVSITDKRKIYKVCYDALRSADMVDNAFSFNVKQLELYNGASEQEIASETVQTDAVRAIIDAVRLPKLYRFDTLLELSAVKRLGAASGPGSEKLQLLFTLLNIFVKDDLDSFLEFSERNSLFLEEVGIDKSGAADKMRLLTFASLGIESQDLSYQVIAQALKIEDSEVEEWVIRAISSGLVDAKINQLRSCVAVYRSTQRLFTREEWQPLSERINIWKENIDDLLTALRETRQASTEAAAEAFSGLV